MKKSLLFIVGTILLMCSCATTSYSVADTIWYGASVAENGEKQGVQVTSLHFYQYNLVDVCMSVLDETGLAVKPMIYAKGLYQVEGDPRKEAVLTIMATTIDGQNTIYKARYHKADAMLLANEDGSIATLVKAAKQ